MASKAKKGKASEKHVAKKVKKIKMKKCLGNLTEVSSI